MTGPPGGGFAGYLAGWSALHGGYAPRGVVLGYLRVVHALARPFLRLPPDAVTALGLAAALAVLWPAAAGGRWALLAALAVLASALADGLDGAVAVLTGRASRWGAVLDSVADRVADLAYLGAFWLLGADARWCVAAAIGLFLLEYARARAAASGLADIAVVTVGERGVRIAVAVAFLLCGGWLGPVWFDLGAAAIAGVSSAGLAQFLLVARRRLR